MELKIQEINVQNFKGIKNLNIALNGKNAVIKGVNGSGKSTVGMLLGWVISDCDLELNKNPIVTPINETECISRVDIKLSLDNKSCQISKSQKFKSKTDDDGKVVSSVTNSYEINDVEMPYKAFVADLEDRGILVDKFLILTNPNAFMSDTSKKGRDEMRKILFEMANDISDEELIKELDNAEELKALLEQGYKLDEIEALNKGTIRKTIEAMGKDNCIAQGRIQGILDSKSKADIKELSKTKAEYEKELNEIKSKISNLRNADNDSLTKIASLEGELLEIEQAERRSLEDMIAKASEAYRKADHDANEASVEITKTKCEADSFFEEKNRVKESLENYRELYKKVQDEVFDETATICPSCQRPFEADKIDEMKKAFEEGKTKRLNEYKTKGEQFSHEYDSLNEKYKQAMDKYEKANKRWKKLDSKADDLKTKMNLIPRIPDLANNVKYTDIQSKIAEKREELQKKGDLKLQEYSNRESYLLEMMRQVDDELAVVNRNKELDEQVKAIRQEIRQAEINISKSEKILDQVNRFRRFKDDKLSLQINSHFKVINWHLSEFQRNGERKEICEPYIGDKSLFAHSNQALQVVAKCDIIRGLSEFWNAWYPVFLDDSSLLTKESIDAINMPNQMIWLCASNGIKELIIDRR